MLISRQPPDSARPSGLSARLSNPAGTLRGAWPALGKGHWRSRHSLPAGRPLSGRPRDNVPL
eukprot:8222827-Alexandrium_andersonii.AAC.1